MKLIIDVDDKDYAMLKNTSITLDWNTVWHGKEKDKKLTFAIFNLTKAIVDGLPYEERSQSEWIPVSERLPEQANQSYLVTVDYGKGIVCSCQRFFFGEDIGWNDDCVIAWQELPKPYKEGGKQE